MWLYCSRSRWIYYFQVAISWYVLWTNSFCAVHKRRKKSGKWCYCEWTTYPILFSISLPIIQEKKNWETEEEKSLENAHTPSTVWTVAFKYILIYIYAIFIASNISIWSRLKHFILEIPCWNDLICNLDQNILPFL